MSGIPNKLLMKQTRKKSDENKQQRDCADHQSRQPRRNVIDRSIDMLAINSRLFTRRRTAIRITGKSRPLITCVTSNTRIRAN